MSDGTRIEWTDATWNPITGCAVVSPGCTNCYAMKLAGTRLRHHKSRIGLTIQTKTGPVWTGDVRFNEDWLLQPLQWKRPRKIFVCAHADLFHENVPDEWIDRVFAVMALAPQHVFQVLTKRPERMREYMAGALGRIADSAIRLRRERGDKCLVVPLPHIRPGAAWWPLPNVWPGTSVEDQSRADERIPHLLATPAAVRWLSMEPLLGPVNIVDAMWAGGGNPMDHLEATIDWIVLGGESGRGARPMHPNWARSVRDQCAAAGVPFHFKQWGNWLHMPGRAHFKDMYREPWSRVSSQQEGVRPALMFNIGKKAAGRVLDGVEHNGLPA